MRKGFVAAFLALFLIAPLFAQGIAEQKTPDSGTVTVYCYDSFTGDWGPGNAIKEGFEAETGLKLNLISCGTSVDMLQRLAYEGSSSIADVVVGIQDSDAVDFSSYAGYTLPGSVNLAASLDVQDGKLVPYDYGVFAFVVNTEKLSDCPTCLDDLLKPEYKNAFILADPRTSSVGMGLLLWTIDIYGEEGYLDWWERAAQNALTIADSWSSAYGLFTEGEAPMVISYTTSPVYHVMYENTTSIRALLFTDGHHQCVEFAGITANASNPEGAKLFMDYLLTHGQKEIAVDNSMYPANTLEQMPAAFEYAPVPEKIMSTDRDRVLAKMEEYLSAWALRMVR